MYGHIYTEAEHQFMKDFVPGHTYREIQRQFIEIFKWEITLGQIKSYIGNHKLNTGHTGQYKKGNIPQNKGKKMSAEVYEQCKKTMFSKGHIPKNHRPVGAERINKDGYIEVKVEEPNKWKLKHRAVWEKINGPVPNGYTIVFKNTDKLNVCIDNLEIISRAELLRMNRQKLFSESSELTETGILIARLDISKNKNKKKKEKL